MALNGTMKLLKVHPRLSGCAFYCAMRSDFDITIVDGDRPLGRQLEYWQAGRNESGQVVDPSLVKTDAPPGESPHNFGLALDWCPTDYLTMKDWNPSGQHWEHLKRLVEAYNRVGGGVRTHIQLRSGTVDKPHVEVLNWREHKEWRKSVHLFAAILSVFALGFVLSGNAT
jgi:hypothetical protein